MMWQKIEYIHNNPVLRGFVDDPLHWRWSSARDYARQLGLIEPRSQAPAGDRISPKLRFAHVPEHSLSQTNLRIRRKSSILTCLAEVLRSSAKQSFADWRSQARAWERDRKARAWERDRKDMLDASDEYAN